MNNISNNHIHIITTINSAEGTAEAFDLIVNNTDNQTIFWFSGGLSPQSIYIQLANTKDFKIAAGVLIDERYGRPNHKDSNELMIRNTGLITSLEKKDIVFFSPLNDMFYTPNSIEKTTIKYSKQIKELITNYKKHILILGVGHDGHTAGIFPNLFTNHPKFISKSKFITAYHTKVNKLQDRITLTPHALEILATQQSILIILVFGKDKEETIQKILYHDPKNPEAPASIYHHLVSRGCKIYLITDQKTT